MVKCCKLSKHGLLVEVECDNFVLEKCKLSTLCKQNHSTSYVYPYEVRKLLSCLNEQSIEIHIGLNEPKPINIKLRKEFKLRDYQLNLVKKIESLDYRGTIVLPTGAGKTILALKVIHTLRQPTLVIVPTIALLKQWENVIESYFSIDGEIGIYGGGVKKIGEITLATYKGASTYNFLIKNMDNFGLIVFDEAHHLLNTLNIEIPMRLIAKYRIGLTATINKTEYIRWQLDKLIGELIFGPTLAELQMRKYSAEIEYKAIPVKLTKLELDLLKKVKKKKDQQKSFIKKLIYFPSQKVDTIEKLLNKHSKDQVIIFTKHKETAKEIAETFGIPLITSDVPPEERARLIKLFSEEKITKIATAEALDEGVDIPSANVAIIVSGSASSRQLIQRIGRVLRPKGMKKAYVYELYTKKSFEEKIYKRRQ